MKTISALFFLLSLDFVDCEWLEEVLFVGLSKNVLKSQKG